MATGHTSLARLSTLLTDPRRFTRYPIALSARFHFSGPAKSLGGNGVTRDFSSHGMYIETNREKSEPGSTVKIVVDWPVALEGGIPLQFIATGKVARCDAAGFGVRILRYEYRTKRKEVIGRPAARPLFQKAAGA
jgi:hypothetical protein